MIFSSVVLTLRESVPASKFSWSHLTTEIQSLLLLNSLVFNLDVPHGPPTRVPSAHTCLSNNMIFQPVFSLLSPGSLEISWPADTSTRLRSALQWGLEPQCLSPVLILKPVPLQISGQTKATSLPKPGVTCKIILLGNQPVLYAHLPSFRSQIFSFSHSLKAQGKKIKLPLFNQKQLRF